MEVFEEPYLDTKNEELQFTTSSWGLWCHTMLEVKVRFKDTMLRIAI